MPITMNRPRSYITSLPRSLAVLLCALWLVSVCPLASYARGIVTDESLLLRDGWEYRWGDSPLDDQKRPVWTYDAKEEGAWRPTESLLNPPGHRNENILWFRVTLPANRWRDPTLYIPNVYEAMEVYMDNKKIYKAGMISSSGTGRLTTTSWNMISLDYGYDGKKLYLRIYSGYRYRGLSRQPHIGSRFDHLLRLIRQDVARMVTGIIYVSIGFFSLLLFLWRRNRREYLAFAVLALAMAVFDMFHTNVTYLFVKQPLVLMYLWLAALFCMPAAVAAFIENIFGAWRFSIFRRFWQAQLIYGIGAFIAMGLGIVNPLNTRFPFYVMAMAISLVAIIFIFLELLKGNKDARIFIIGLACLVGAGMMDAFTAVFVTDTMKRVTAMTHVGMFVFTVSLTLILARHFRETYVNLHKYSKELESTRDELRQYAGNLETMVDARTKELSIAKDELEAAMVEIESHNANLVEVNQRLEETQRIARNDMRMAINVQSNFLPRIAPAVGDWDIAFYYQPLRGISGDFYDFYAQDNSLAGVALFDVSGHGISSGLITMLAKSIIFRTFSKMQDRPLNIIMEEFNRGLLDEIGNVENYISGILLRLNGERVEYVNAGHPGLMIRERSTNKAHERSLINDSSRGTFLGLSSIADRYNVDSFSVSPGDTLIVFTDALAESFSASHTQYGEENILSSLNNAPPDGTAQETLNFMLEDFYRFVDSGEVFDDLTLVILKKTAV